MLSCVRLDISKGKLGDGGGCKSLVQVLLAKRLMEFVGTYLQVFTEIAINQ